MIQKNDKANFGFEDLEVWQKAIDFADRIIDMIDGIQTDRKHYRLIENLEASCTSVSLNIAEGKGRYSKKEFIQFLYVARGSLYETVSQLLLFHKRKWISDKQLEELKGLGNEIGKMISGLVNAIKD